MSLEAAHTPASANGADPFAALVSLADAIIGARLCTMMLFDRASGMACRTHTNMPDSYPVTGTKPVVANEWTATVLDLGEIFVANDIEAIAKVFPDPALIESLGCGAVINIPITVNGAVAGSLNCLDAAGHYTPSRVAASDRLRVPATKFLLRHVLAPSSPVQEHV